MDVSTILKRVNSHKGKYLPHGYMHTGTESVSQSLSCVRLCDPVDCSPDRLLCLWDCPGKNTGVGCLSFLQGIFPAQGMNLGLLRCRQTLYRLSN